MAIDLDEFFSQKRRYSFPFDLFIKEIPSNGIYILFEKGERHGNYDRIVRVGTHTGNNQLRSRLKQHFIKENKNRSIFRKNIGRCFLNKENNPYLSLWEFDITSKGEKEKNLKLLDLDFEREMEKKISSYIQTNFTFCTFQIDPKEERLFWERKITSTLARAADIEISKSWLGNYSPKDKIKKSGLWQVNELYHDCLTDSEIERLKYLIIHPEP